MHLSLEQLSPATSLLLSTAAAHRLVLEGSRSTHCCIAIDAPAAGQAAKPTQAAPKQGSALTSVPEGVRDARLAAGSVHRLVEIPPGKPTMASPGSPLCTAGGDCQGHHLPAVKLKLLHLKRLQQVHPKTTDLGWGEQTASCVRGQQSFLIQLF